MPIRIPKYRKRPDRNVAFAEYPRGNRVYFPGRHDSPESKAAYNRWLIGVLGEPEAVVQPQPPAGRVQVIDLVKAFLDWAKLYYLSDGKPGSEYHCLKSAATPLLKVADTQLVNHFGPKDLKAARADMVLRQWKRDTVNDQVGRIRRIFKWGVEHELVPEHIWRTLQAVSPLGKGRTAAPESEEVRPVDPAHVQAVLKKVSPVVAAMIELQQVSGMRPQDVCQIRPIDVDRSDDVWTYRPPSHKGDWREGEVGIRIVPLGPRAQAILAPWLDRDPQAYCFSPAESESLRRKPRGRGKPRQHALRTYYVTASYRRAIHRGCELAFNMPKELRKIWSKLPDDQRDKPKITAQRKELQAKAATWRSQHCWNPNQLRHNVGTAVRKKYGLEAAQVFLGHSKADVTEIYAERDQDLARQIAREMG
ncbi:MAG: site-specific integrase [Planctomycetota bacterium]